MDRGWAPLWRKSDESAVFQDAHLWRLWTWLLIRTTHEKRFVTMSTGRGEVVVPLEPGQCIVGRHSGSKALGWPSSTFRNRLEKLSKPPFECINIRKDTHCSVITIVKWKAYDDARKQLGQAKDKQRTSKGHKEEPKEVKTFNRPSLDEVETYCRARGNSINPQGFLDSNDAKGWVVGKLRTPMKDWKAVIRTWEGNEKPKRRPDLKGYCG